MYPETDIPSINVMPEEVKFARDKAIEAAEEAAAEVASRDEAITKIQKNYGLNSQLSEQIFDSEYMEVFEKICEIKKSVRTGQPAPNFIASILCSSITNLERQGLDITLLKPEHIIEFFKLLAADKIPKEDLEIIFECIVSGKIPQTAGEMLIRNLSMPNGSVLPPEELLRMFRIVGGARDMQSDILLNKKLDKIIQDNMELVKNNYISTLMGIAMKELRGSYPGYLINELLRKKVSEL
jgi:glutamyl-tRNA(Gln) amidotransferase subunit E